MASMININTPINKTYYTIYEARKQYSRNDANLIIIAKIIDLTNIVINDNTNILNNYLKFWEDDSSSKLYMKKNNIHMASRETIKKNFNKHKNIVVESHIISAKSFICFLNDLNDGYKICPDKYLYSKYKKIKPVILKLIKNINCYQNNIKSNQNDIKNLFQFISDILKKKKLNRPITRFLYLIHLLLKININHMRHFIIYIYH